MGRGPSSAITTRINRLAAAGHGVVTRSQLRQDGLQSGAIERRVARGDLRRVTRSVLVVPAYVDLWTPAAIVQARWPRAVVWGQLAAALWDLDGFDRPHPAVLADPALMQHAARSGSRSSAMKRTAILTADEVTFRNGLRLTTVVRTLGDLGQSAGPDLVERALECALRSHLVEIADIDTWLAARPDQRWPGATTLRGVLERRGRVVPPTESDAETLFAQLARVHEAEPFRQHDVWHGDQWVGRADFFFPVGRGLAIEVDGYATHGTPAALQYDLSRQNGVVLADHAVLRFTWADIARRPATTWRVVDQKLRALAAEAGLRANHESPAPDDRRRGYSSSSMDDKRPSRTTTG